MATVVTAPRSAEEEPRGVIQRAKTAEGPKARCPRTQAALVVFNASRMRSIGGLRVIPRVQTVLFGLLLAVTNASVARADSLYQASSAGNVEQVRQLIADGA